MPRVHRLERTQQIDQPLDAVFGFFADASNLQDLPPAFLRFHIRTPGPIEMKPGARIDVRHEATRRLLEGGTAAGSVDAATERRDAQRR